LALVLYDDGRWPQAAEVLGAAQQLFRRIGQDPRNPEQFQLDAGNSFRRTVMIKSSVGRLDKGETFSRFLDNLAEWTDTFEKARQFDGFVANLDVASRLAANIGRQELAHGYAERALARKDDAEHWWPLQEILWREAEYFHEKHDRAKNLACVVRALRLGESYPVILEPVPSAHGTRPNDPARNIVRYQITLEELAEHDVGVGESLQRRPLRLNDAEVDRFVNVILSY